MEPQAETRRRRALCAAGWTVGLLDREGTAGQHWHGALPDHFMTHLAMWEDDDATWGGHVTDDEYAAAGDAGRPED